MKTHYKIFFTLIISLVGISCTPGQDGNSSSGGASELDKKYKDIMAVHDDVMPELDIVRDYKLEFKDELCILLKRIIKK